MAALFDVVGVGINSVDRVAVLPGFPQASGPLSKMRLREYQTQSGGQTATALVACARLGLRTAYVGAVGDDADGALVREALAAARVDTSATVVHRATTRMALILVDEASGQRAVLWQFDERLKLTDSELAAAPIGTARLVHVDDVDEAAALAAARMARDRGIPVTSDIDQVTDRTVDLLETVTVAIFAEHVPEQLARRGVAGLDGSSTTGHAAPGIERLRETLRSLPRRPGQALVVTLGDRGALALDDAGFHYHAGYRVQAVDTTGAGDVFRAGFIYALLKGLTLDEQLRCGNAAAAISCTRPGAMASAPTLKEVEGMLGSG